MCLPWPSRKCPGGVHELEAISSFVLSRRVLCPRQQDVLLSEAVVVAGKQRYHHVTTSITPTNG